ncbi:MAG: class I SAM-dependent RNA methyltransferase [Actinomyces sp.]|uniref:class I SAM-dependent RNA methyltransferase n=1 Tax=Actinomyces sp. TaxID=29317 RepID=UPI0026DDBF37|nr:class I SAM-dependent RNA methyltransferase [Actinomyces sp.]MDO4243431.1 class I SAM-dependent RNA methyltransferase [Actinomyces sp.]
MSPRSVREDGAPEPLELVLAVGAPAHGGHCLARPADDPGGRVFFVRHALPGETVRARVTGRGSKAWRADALEVLEASPDRVPLAWPEAGPGGVGGGELSHVSPAAQRDWKRHVLADCLRRIGGEAVARAVAALSEAQPEGVLVEPVGPSPSAHRLPGSGAPTGVGTRTRVSLTVTPDGRAGMHAFRSSEVLAVRRLPLAVPQIQALGLTEAGRWRKRYRPGMRVEVVAPSLGEPVVVLDGVVHTAAARPTARRRVEERVDASGIGLGELSYGVRVDGFWQVHRDAPTVLVDRVVRAALSAEPTAAGTRPGDGPPAPADRTRVLELYSGAGLFTLPLAMLGGTVLSLEGSERAVRDARRNLHALRGAHLRAGRVTADSVASLGAHEAMGDGPDVVVLDPPRQGAGQAVAGAVAALGARRIVLVACDPAALARDLAVLLGRGYRLGAMSALDMFPHTHHLEVIAVLDRC